MGLRSTAKSNQRHTVTVTTGRSLMPGTVLRSAGNGAPMSSAMRTVLALALLR